jgi:ribosomal protein L32
MAVPKKKSSRSRTGMRRYSTAYKMDPVTGTTCAFTHEPVRTHTVSMKAIKDGLYDAAAVKLTKKAAKKTTKKTSKSASASA